MEEPQTTDPDALRAVVIDWTGVRSEGQITVLGTDRVFLRFAADTAPELVLGETIQLEFSDHARQHRLIANSIAIRRVELEGLRQYEFKFADPDDLWLRHGSDLPDIFSHESGAAVPPNLRIPVTVESGNRQLSLHGEVRELSSDGMTISIQGHKVEPLAAVDRVHLSFEVPQDSGPVDVWGRITKRSLFDGGHRYGLEFEEGESTSLAEDRKRIDRWVTATHRDRLQARATAVRHPARTIQSRIFLAMWAVNVTFITIVMLVNLHLANRFARGIDTGHELVLLLIGAGITASLASLLISRGIARKLTNPIRELTRVSCEFAEGNMDSSVPEPVTRELAVLTGSFNRMAERIQLLLADAKQQAKVVEQQWAQLELSTAKDEFLVIVSHELRTPLTSIISFTDILLTFGKEEDPQTQDEFLRVIKQQSDRLNRLIDQLMDLAKLQTGTLSWHLSEMDLAEVVHSSVASVIDPRDGALVRVKTNLPNRRCPFTGDETRLRDMVINLVDNGRKFSPEDEPISVSLKCVDGGYEICVSDRGRGVKNEDKERIFQKFVQIGDLLTDRPKGTGLGLSISHEVVKAHGGRIGCRDNDSGRGAVFVVFLPMPDPDNLRPVDDSYRLDCPRQSNAIAVP